MEKEATGQESNTPSISNEKIQSFDDKNWGEVSNTALSINDHLGQIYSAELIRSNFEEFRKNEIKDSELLEPKNDEQVEMVNLLSVATGLVDRSNHLQQLRENATLSKKELNEEILIVIKDTKGLLLNKPISSEEIENFKEINEEKVDLDKEIGNSDGETLIEKGVNFLFGKTGFEEFANEEQEELRNIWTNKAKNIQSKQVDEFESTEDSGILESQQENEEPFSDFEDSVDDSELQNETFNSSSLSPERNMELEKLGVEIENNMDSLNRALDQLKSNVLGI